MSPTPPHASACMGLIAGGECGSSKSRVAQAAMQSAPTFNPAPLYERLLALPDHLTGEILNGQLHTQPRPSGRHGFAGSGLNIDIGGPFDFGRGGPGGWWILPGPEVHFVRDVEVAVPDLAGWRRARMPPSRRISASRSCRIGCARSFRPPPRKRIG